MQVAVFNLMKTVMPAPALFGYSTINLKTARNAFPCFQIAVRDTGSFTLTDVTASDLVFTRGSTVQGTIPLSNIMIYVEGLINIVTPSTIEGTVGQIPDILIPRKDDYFGETRNAFPLSVAANTTRAIWIEIYVPISTPPGTYTGTITLTMAQSRTVSYTVEVSSAILPSTPSMESAYPPDYTKLLGAHGLSGSTNRQNLMNTYTIAGLRHRLGNPEVAIDTPVMTGSTTDWTSLDAQLGPFLDPAALMTGSKLPGAVLPSVRLKYYSYEYVPTSGKITLAGSSGSVNSISVNGVVITGGAVAFRTDLATTAADVAANINAFVSSPNYNAYSKGAVVYIKAFPEASPDPNGFAITNSLTTLTSTIVNMANASGSGGQNSRTKAVQYMKNWADHIRTKGWDIRKFYAYITDEPQPTDVPKQERLSDTASVLHEADPSLRAMVTSNPKDLIAGGKYEFIDLIVPTIRYMDDKTTALGGDDAHVGDQRATYTRQVWIYQACGSHGCSIKGGDPTDDPLQYHTGWPATMADLPPLYHRMFEWMSYKYNVQGQLYFDMIYAFSLVDPWVAQGGGDPHPGESGIFFFGGNGDGTLYYPGTPAKIGGTTHIPVESIRLKRIRAGQEDYELMRLMEDRVGRTAVLEIVNSLVLHTYNFNHDTELFEIKRQELLAGASA